MSLLDIIPIINLSTRLESRQLRKKTHLVYVRLDWTIPIASGNVFQNLIPQSAHGLLEIAQ